MATIVGAFVGVCFGFALLGLGALAFAWAYSIYKDAQDL